MVAVVVVLHLEEGDQFARQSQTVESRLGLDVLPNDISASGDGLKKEIARLASTRLVAIWVNFIPFLEIAKFPPHKCKIKFSFGSRGADRGVEIFFDQVKPGEGDAQANSVFVKGECAF